MHLKSWAREKGLAWDTIETQAWFFVYELQSDYPVLFSELLTAVKPLKTLTANISVFYERPAASSANLDARIKYAEDSLALVKSRASPPILINPSIPAITGGAGVVVAAAVAQGSCASCIWIAVALLLPALIVGAYLASRSASRRFAKTPDEFVPPQPDASTIAQFKTLLAERDGIRKRLDGIRPVVQAEADELQLALKRLDQ